MAISTEKLTCERFNFNANTCMFHDTMHEIEPFAEERLDEVARGYLTNSLERLLNAVSAPEYQEPEVKL
jgi:hypothetical protein